MANPWEDGPRELLQHAVEHMSVGGDFDRRMAMISIDNAVEVTMKTYLSLPKRMLGVPAPTRKEFDDAKNSFPFVLDLLEKYAGSKLNGVSLEELEWYHRIQYLCQSEGWKDSRLGMNTAQTDNNVGNALE